ncbi:N-acetylmannosamine-6-phosphate 2-epimerase [Microbacterium sp. 3J1]|uniref:N-acetylmannosamine-6-phosphate 2-epimerase n=1 Tax=Microbacterium sp. 3J1 TaxID=861269 RepID=UPI000B07F164|nr:N-acetylmannosamine-6-phosphate 2-epimerase [Microbacterium sp. 3J1]
MRFPDALDRLRGGLVVSCQAYPGEAMRDPRTMSQVAAAALVGGAVGIRVQGIADIRGVADLPVPIVGLWKDGDHEVFITPTLNHAKAVADAGADVVAIDGTRRPRPDGLTLAQTVEGLRTHTDALIMADCGSLDDALAAEAAGVDILGTTLSGYTGERPKTDGPDLDLIGLIAGRCALPIMAEGRIHTPAQAAAAIAAGAFSVCVGTAITHPSTITTWFADAVAKARP